MEAAKNLKTPRDILEERYRKHLMATYPGSLYIALSSLVCGGLEGMATKAIKAHRLRLEAMGRFGDD